MASQQTTNDVMFQIGRMSQPVHIVSYGNKFDDANKNTKAASVMVFDADTVSSIHQRELEVSVAYPGMRLVSCIGAPVQHPETGVTGFLVRLKLTTNERCYHIHEDAPGAAPSLDKLCSGHTAVLQCRRIGWTYKDSCGITIYANLVRGLGVESKLWASHVHATSSVVWA